MRWTVVIPGALVPASIGSDVLAAAATPWLARALSRSESGPVTVDCGSAPHLAWLWQQFGGEGEPVTAPYVLRALDADSRTDAYCWHVDLVHFAFARDHLVVTPLDEELSPEEEARLAHHLRSALRELPDRMSPALHIHRGRWLLELAHPWTMRTTPLDSAIGRSAHEHWPEGADGAAWRRLLNDVQMRWHQDAINDAREARGKRPVNGLWLHGGGAWMPLPRRPFAAVAGADPVLRGWGLASGLAREAMSEDDAMPPAGGDVVSIRRDLLAPAQFEAWGQWLDRLTQLEASLRDLQRACSSAGCEELALVLCGRRQFRIVRLRRRDNWRVWRRTALAPLFTEQ
jgi:hypothetical protein